MILDYTYKNISKINEKDITGVLITYEITKEDMFKLAALQQEITNQIDPLDLNNSLQVLRIGLHKKDSNLYDLVCDNLRCGRLLEGGITTDNKCILSYYIISKGMDKLINILHSI